MVERDKAFDIAPFRALLEQCRADVTVEKNQRMAADFPSRVATLFQHYDAADCSTPGGRCMFEVQLADLNAAESIAIIKEQARSPIEETARRFQRAQAELDALPSKIATPLDQLAAKAKEAQETATRFHKDSLVVADAEVQRGLKTCGYALMFDPKHAGCLKQKAALDAMAVAFDKEREAFYATAFHKENLGKVLFTVDEEKLGSENAADFKASFRADEPLSGVVYLRYPVGMLSGDIAATTTVSITFAVEGKRIGGAAWFVAPEDEAHGQAWVSFVAMPAAAKDAADIYTTSDLANALAALPEGKHQVKVTIGVLNADGSKGVEAASGTLEYDAASGHEKAKGIAEALAARVLDEARMPKAAMKDARLDKAMLAEAANNEFGDKPLRLVTTDRAFTITRNWLGVIMRRSVHTAVATKGKDGTCMVRQIEFTQQYEGKTYGAPTMSYPSDEFPIRCENVKK